jgi:hypothetical protein
MHIYKMNQSDLTKMSVKKLRTYVTEKQLFKNLGGMRKAQIIQKILESQATPDPAPDSPPDTSSPDPTSDSAPGSAPASAASADSAELGSVLPDDEQGEFPEIRIITQDVLESLLYDRYMRDFSRIIQAVISDTGCTSCTCSEDPVR